MADNVTLPGTGEVVGAVEKTDESYVQKMALDLGSGTTSKVIVAGRQAQADCIPVAEATPDNLDPGTPSHATISDAGATRVADANSTRRGLILTNLSSGNISIAFAPSVPLLGRGITLQPGSSWMMTRDCFSTAQIDAIAEEADSELAIQEFS